MKKEIRSAQDIEHLLKIIRLLKRHTNEIEEDFIHHAHMIATKYASITRNKEFLQTYYSEFRYVTSNKPEDHYGHDCYLYYNQTDQSITFVWHETDSYEDMQDWDNFTMTMPINLLWENNWQESLREKVEQDTEAREQKRILDFNTGNFVG